MRRTYLVYYCVDPFSCPCRKYTQTKRRKEEEKNIFFRKFNSGLESLKQGYEKLLRTLIKFWYVVGLAYLVLLFAAYGAFKVLPTGFLPNEDQGTLIASISMQPGTTLHNVEEVAQKVVKIFKETEGVADVIAINGYNMIASSMDSSTVTIFLILEDWSERKSVALSSEGIIKKLTLETKEKIKEAGVRIFSPPSIPGLSAVGGFEFKLQNLNAIPLEDFEKIAREFIDTLKADQRIMMAYTMFNANYPQLYIDIDRDKVFSLRLNLSDVFSVLQTYLGSYYVNDFNKFGKTYRVFMQADDTYRTNSKDISKFFVKNNKDEMIPLSTVASIKNTVGANSITHFNAYQSIAINGVHNIREGYSSADAITAIEEIAEASLPSNVGYAYSGITLQEKEAGSAAIFIFILSLVMVFLFLSAQYESWMTPMIIMLPIPVVLFGALGSNMLAGLLNDTYTQIGLVLLIGMSAKNAILIVEFAKELHETGVDLVESAIQEHRYCVCVLY
ncbi:MAG: efflux RND transporter permease subunit [Sulfurovum sp.]|nr:efflux RND transporter permease subunit [Sulfurovum sp.]